VQPMGNDDKSLAVKGFVDYMNLCLENAGRRLTFDARRSLCDYVGEIIDNAEQHAQMTDWTIQGYLDTNLPVPMCEIAILNFGRSFAHTLSDLSPESYTAKQVAHYLDLHTARGWFGIGWRRDDLLTLIALQGMVSSKNTSEDTTRGNGTADLIEFFQQMHEECNAATGLAARMSIISGTTQVVFDGTYKIQPNQNQTRIIAFNKSNNLAEQPDTRYVRSLANAALPGTLITIQFPLSAESLSQTDEDNGHE